MKKYTNPVKENSMKNVIQMTDVIRSRKSCTGSRPWPLPGSLFPLALIAAIVAASPIARGVSPPPDGGYPNANTAEGDRSLLNLTSGNANTAIGASALQSDTTASRNTAVGVNALFSNPSDPANDNTAIGDNALFFNTSAFNTAVGSNALFSNRSGSNNTAVGYQALKSNTTGPFNTAVGESALFSNTSGDRNTAIGDGAMIVSTTGFQNTAVGVSALRNNTTGSQNVAVGQDACNNNQDATGNTGVGYLALQLNHASGNTALGFQALLRNTTGDGNTASGWNALVSNTTGNFNTATGFVTLENNTTGMENTGNGLEALFHNTTGNGNTATGFNALLGNTTGNNNTAVGFSAGQNLTVGANNIDIGANVLGNAGEANTIRIGKQGTQKSTLIAGIFGTAVTGSSVVVSSTGKLGVATSSARFKEAIKPMDKASEAILTLKPVTFRYKAEIDPDKTAQFGLIAEEVAKVDPDLITRDESGKPVTVRYEAVNAMLLNEFLKARRELDEEKDTVAQQQKQIAALTAGLKAQADQIQKVSAQLQVSRSAPQVVANAH